MLAVRLSLIGRSPRFRARVLDQTHCAVRSRPRVGLVVDDAIVVVSVQHHIELGCSAHATLQAMREVSDRS